jgi:multiple sugar transport system permease protein
MTDTTTRSRRQVTAGAAAPLGVSAGGRPPRRSGRQRAGGTRIEPYLFILPAAILLASLMVVPILIVINYSFRQDAVTVHNAPFVGFQNYVDVLTDPNFQGSIGNTVVFVVVSVLAHLLLGLAFASLLNTKLLGRVPLAVFRTIYLLPWVFTVAIVAVLWRLLLDPDGVVNHLLRSFGDDKIAWLGDQHLALGAVTFINIWAGYPFFMISILAGMQSISADMYEASRVDGAGPLRRFWSITLPQLRPVIISMTLLDLIWTSQQFALIWITTGGGPLNTTNLLATYTYQLAFQQFKYSQASASGVLVLVLSMVLAYFYVRHQRKDSL